MDEQFSQYESQGEGERPTYTKQIIIGIALIAAATAGSYAWYSYFFPSEEIMPLTNVGFDGELPADQTVSGFIYFSGAPESDPEAFDTHRLDTINQSVIPVTTTGNNTGMAYLSDTAALFVSGDDEFPIEHPDANAPVLTDFARDMYFFIRSKPGYFERHLAGFDGGNQIVYAQRVKYDEDDLFYEIADWEIVYSQHDTNSHVSIAAATSPVLLNQNNTLMYVKYDGIYTAALDGSNEQKTTLPFVNLQADVELALSPDERFLVITIPTNQSVAVVEIINLEANEFRLLGIMQDTGFTYHSPVINPDSRLYAVIQESVNGNRASRVQVRAFANTTVLQEYDMSGFVPWTVRLDMWRSERIGEGMIVTE